MEQIIYNFGDNTITVKVTAKDGITTKEYVIALYKTTQEEENKNIMLLNEGEKIKETTRKNKITVGEIVFIVIISGSTLGIIYMLIRKYRKER